MSLCISSSSSCIVENNVLLSEAEYLGGRNVRKLLTNIVFTVKSSTRERSINCVRKGNTHCKKLVKS